MADLELVGIHPDGDHLILIGPDGDRHRLAIDEAVRVAVRRDRPQLEKLRSDGVVRPREIQVMIRGGSSAETVAAETGLPVEQVRRYEGPILAEREHVASRARSLRMGRDADSPTLGDMVIDRLAARGVDQDSLSWDSRRHGQELWELIARFHAGEREREATWEVDLTSGTFAALDDESRWLSETDLGSGSRHLSSVRGARLYDIETDADIAPSLRAVDAVIRDSRPRIEPEARGEPADEAAAEPETDPTEAILAELNASRGIRQPVEIDDDALAAQVLADAEAQDQSERTESESQPALFEAPSGAHPAASRPQDATDATVLKPPQPPAEPDQAGSGSEAKDADDQTAASNAAPQRRRARRSRRTSVPSWDEIVFGAKND